MANEMAKVPENTTKIVIMSPEMGSGFMVEVRFYDEISLISTIYLNSTQVLEFDVIQGN